MATLSFLSGQSSTINNLAGSGLAFMGASFGFAVQVGSYNDSCWISNGGGVTQGPQVDNCKYISATTGEINGVNYYLKNIPNYLATLNVRLTNSTAISTQNGKVYIYDRVNKNNNPSGLTCQIAELIHPWDATTPLGSGSTSFTNAAGSGSTLSLGNSPGLSGISPGASVQHDFYLLISASPQSIGSKTNFGLFVELEFA